MSKQARISSIRLMVAGVCSLVLLAGVAFPIFAVLGSALGQVIPAVICIFTLVILTPVVFGGSGTERVLALLLAPFPALLLLSIIVFSKAFVR
jgi:hypothetical protein